MTDYTVAAVKQAMHLLHLVSCSPGLGVTELAQRSGSTKARTFRLLHTLESDHFVMRRGEPPTYWLAERNLYLGAAAQEQVPLARVAHRHVMALGAHTGENVLLRVRDGLSSVCIDRCSTAVHLLRVRSEIPNRRSLHAGASCKLLLAYAPKDVQQQVDFAGRSLFQRHERAVFIGASNH